MKPRLPLRAACHLAALALLVSASGATCQRTMVNPFAVAVPAAPQVLIENAPREQIISAVNANSAKVQSVSVTGAAITIPEMMGLPILTGNIAAERPNRFRLTASMSFGSEVDLGSNDELFWLWVKRNQPPAVYFCRHAQFANSAIRQVMPVEPSWLLAALGMIDIDPAQVFDGPLPSPRGAGTVELRTWLPSASGRLQRVLVIDARRAWVLEQHIYDEAGKTLLASSVAETHRYYPDYQLSLPDKVSIRLPASNIAFKINLGQMQINQLGPNSGSLWTMPTFDGYQQHDLGGASLGTTLPSQTPAQSSLQHVVPTGFGYPTTPYPTTPSNYPTTQPASSTSAAASMNARYNPLPRYGQRSPATTPAVQRR